MRFELRQAVEAYDFIQQQIAACDQRLKTLLEALPARPVAEREAQAGAAEADQRSKRRRTRQRNTPGFDLKEELTRIRGVDPTRIDGIDVMTIQTFVAEVGTDMN